MARTKLSPRLGFETLERRDTPALFNPAILTGEIFQLEPAPDFGSITHSGLTVTATGTNSDDVIKAYIYTPVLTQRFNSDLLDNVAIHGQLVVSITDAAGNVRTDANGVPLTRMFHPDTVHIINVDARGGNDRVSNATSKMLVAQGGDANDTMTGGPGRDILNGGNGNDSLLGGAGIDVMSGMAGDDRMSGQDGDDVVQGGAGFDVMNGGAGNDKMDGEAGNDWVLGAAGNDDILGWDGDDILLGEDGDDKIHGNLGNDFVSGGNGKDDLFGGANNDDVEGGAGNDGLFGGAGKDTLNGGSGIDRFLKWVAAGNTTIIEGAQSYESITSFKDTTSTQTFSVQGLTLRYQPAAWTEEQIEQVDGGLDFLHTEVGNTKMLKLSSGGNLTMFRYGDYMPYNATDGNNDANDQRANDMGPGFTGFNRNNGQIWFGDGAFTSNFEVAETTIHELAHNWDKENGKFNEWKALSGWVESTTPNMDQMLSRDGRWVYNSTAEFFRGYGRTNPYEDFATSFEAYYRLKLGLLSYADLVRMTPKLNFIGLMITRLGQ